MYLLMTEELGLFGVMIIGILLWMLWKTRSPLIGAIMVAGVFDHYWWTTAQGTFLFASALAISWRKEEDAPGPKDLEREKGAYAFFHRGRERWIQ